MIRSLLFLLSGASAANCAWVQPAGGNVIEFTHNRWEQRPVAEKLAGQIADVVRSQL
jgi:hypothetical protein